MSCYHPLKGFLIGKTENGKPKYKICSYDTQYVFHTAAGSWVPVNDKLTGRAALNPNIVSKHILIPCGKCIDCRLKYSRQWADRLMLELGYHEESWFVTLTYNEENVPIHGYQAVDTETGEFDIRFARTLFKKDVQDFMKRLRINYKRDLKQDNKIRFFCAGEYGSKTMRPHYHMIIFGLHLPRDDLTPVVNKSSRYPIFSSRFLSDTWGKGFVSVGAVTWDTCAYTARYIMKKHKGLDADFYEKNGISPEFTLMSRMPGIAEQYFRDHGESIYEFDKIWLRMKEKGYQTCPSRYFDKLEEKVDPLKLLKVKRLRRKTADAMVQDALNKTKLEYLEYLQNRENVHASRIKGLQRRFEDA